MNSVRVYCCGEIIVCRDSVNTCEICGMEYDHEGDKLHEVTYLERIEHLYEDSVIRKEA